MRLDDARWGGLRELGTCGVRVDDEVRAAVAPIWHYFGAPGRPTTRSSAWRAVLPAERMHAAWEDGRAVGAPCAFPSS